MAKEMPVYLFTGFLEAGKTQFIQTTLEDPNFNAGEKTLVIQCEEGIEEFRHERFWEDNVVVEVLDEPQQINNAFLKSLEKKHKPERVMIEYNGMWMLDQLFQEMPENWIIYQEYSFYDANTFLTYNQNMRQLVYDKLKSADCVVFNRYREGMDRMPLHKVVRGVSRRPDIFYELPSGDAIVDDIEDPLPFDKEAPVIEIRDEDFALWYRDLSEDMNGYDGKTVRVKGITGASGVLEGSDFIFGRQVMTCCVEDIQMAGLVCEWHGVKPAKRSWVIVTAKIRIGKSRAYGSKTGPILAVQKVEGAEPPEQEVATFY